MRTFLATWIVGCAGLVAVSSTPGQTAPPVPAPSVPPPPPATPTEEAEKPEKKGPEITLGSKTDNVIPGKHGDALVDGGKIDVQTPEPNTLTAALTGVTAAHCFLGFHSQGIQTFQLVQEFDIASTDTSISSADLELKSTLNGYVRSNHKGSACMRLASASVSPAGGGGAPLSVSFAPMSVNGCGKSEYKQEYTSPAGPPMPLGRYVLQANFVLEASADGLVNGRGVADFSPDDLPDIWKQEKDPFKDAERKDFGFNVTLTANAPGSSSQAKAKANEAKTALQIRPLAPTVRQVSFNPQPVLSTRTVAPSAAAGRARR